jgi:hypothetical protein
MIGTADFAAACQSAREQLARWNAVNEAAVRPHSLAELRRAGIFPME